MALGFLFSIGHKIVETMAIETDLKEAKSCKSKEVLASTCCCWIFGKNLNNSPSVGQK